MDDVECIVIGGGAAGLSAALTLGRARRRALLVDAGQQSNLVAHAIGGLIGQAGRPPADLYEQARGEVASHPSTAIVADEVVASGIAGTGSSFELQLERGGSVRAPRIVLAPGMDYRIPEIEGAAQRWGTTVFHCPFCHGWEVRGRPLAVHGSDAAAVHRALLLRAWSEDVTVLTGGLELADDLRDQLAGTGVAIEERPIARLHGDGTSLEEVLFEDGDAIPCEGLLLHASMHQRSSLAADLGVEIAAPGPISAGAVVVDEHQRTNVPGIWAAGDAAAPMPSITDAIATGMRAGAMAVAQITSTA